MTKILWVVNVPLPEASKLMQKDSQPFGGWLIELSKQISSGNNIDLYIAFPSYEGKTQKISGKKITYYSVHQKRFTRVRNYKQWKTVIEDISPDLINVFGTEFNHTLEVIKIADEKNIKSVITLQGLPSFIANHSRAQLPKSVFYGFTLRNFILMDNDFGMVRKYRKKGDREREALQLSNHVIGRTEWDKACSFLLNSNVNYYHCDETLRESFMTSRWDYSNVEKYSIFMSQGEYSIKGLHLVLNIFSEILHKYPDAKLYIAGNDISVSKGIYQKLLTKQYYRYIRKLIKKNNLQSNVNFTGRLDEESMKQRYLRSHVFLSASSIENSPNSVKEALKLGVPTISSYVGGVPDLVEDNINGLLYQSDAPYLIPSKIEKVFEDDLFAKYISKNAIQSSNEWESNVDISARLLKIYSYILNK